VQDAHNYRALRLQVVLQARDDVESADFSSVDYAQAAAFFVGAGQWAEARTSIAEMVDLHPDDLSRLGRQVINCRRAQEGLPPLAIHRVPAVAAPLPVLFATMPSPPAARSAPASTKYLHIYGDGSGRINPFSPFRPKKGETSAELLRLPAAHA
jgi:hypothetical protein